MNQIYAHTMPMAKKGYTGFLQAFEDSGKISVVVRQHEGGASGEVITVSAEEAEKFAQAILASVKAMAPKAEQPAAPAEDDEK